jgi:hypothetical protein
MFMTFIDQIRPWLVPPVLVPVFLGLVMLVAVVVTQW